MVRRKAADTVRKTNGRGGDGFRNDGAQEDTASVIPIETMHEEPPSDTIEPVLLPVELPELEFEDSTSFINLAFLRESVKAKRSVQAHSDAIPLDSETESETASESSFTIAEPSKDQRNSNGKRLLTPGSDNRLRPEKRSKGREGSIQILSTACLFEVLMREPEAAAIAKDIRGLLGRNESCEILSDCSTFSVDLVDLAGETETETTHYLKKYFRIHDDTGKAIARLPIVDTDTVDASRRPHRWSNGTWIASFVVLSQAGLAKARSTENDAPLQYDAQLNYVTKSPPGPYSTFDEALTLEFRLQLFCRKDSFVRPFTLSNTHYAEHLDRVFRFAFADDRAEQSIRQHSEVNAGIVYGALRSSTLDALDAIQPRLLHASLFPFQKKSVNFLLGREGRRIVGKDEQGSVLTAPIDGIMAHDGVQDVGLFWREVTKGLFYNPFTSSLTTSISATRESAVRGGILAEEMGLGKTVEIFALILLNPDPTRSLQPAYFDEQLEVEVWPTKTTLIVAPEVLRQQWLDEAALHAPELRAFNYYGYKQAAQQIPSGSTWAEFARQFDVMVVSFDTLRQEVNVARKAPNRSRRFERKYERPRSLLIQLAFHRVVMDEVQLVGHSMAAETVSMIARNYSIAVSGTPLKQMSDLESLFKFLQVPGPVTSKQHWARMLQPQMIPTLTQALGVLATRHTKSQVRKEMTLPQQTRILVPIEFTAVESAFYRDIYRRLLSALGVDPNGFTSRAQLLSHIRSTFGEDVAQLRSTLLALRQACTHPQIAGSGVRGSALASSQTIRSMDEVLTIMIDGSKSEFDSIWHSLVQKRIDRAVLLLQRKQNVARHDIAKAMLNASLDDIELRTESLKKDMLHARVVGPLYKFDRSDLERDVADGIDANAEEELGLTSAQSKIAVAYQSQAEREKDHELTEKRMLRRRHINALQLRLRNFLEQKHRCFHFLGNIHFQLGELEKEDEKRHKDENEPSAGPLDQAKSEVNDDAQADEKKDDEIVSEGVLRLKKLEDESYDKAEEVRQELLKETRKSVEQALNASERQAIDFDVDDMFSREELGNGGLRSNVQFDMLNELQDKLDEHAQVVFQWRAEVWQRLSKPVNRTVSAEDEHDDQYQENLDAQAEAEALLEMYRILLSEREYMLSGIRIEGALGMPQLYVQLEREVPQFERALRRSTLDAAANGSLTPAVEQQRRAVIDEWLPSEQEVGVMRQQLDHFRKLDRQKNRVAISREAQQSSERLRAQRRNGVQEDHSHGGEEEEEEEESDIAMQDLRPFDAILRELREIVQNADGREEQAIIRIGIDKVRQLIGRQRQMVEKLKRESASFSTAWNARAAYFKQIQDLSDQVADIVTDNPDTKAANLEREEATLKRREEICAGRLRYLKAIEEEEEESGSGGENATQKDGVEDVAQGEFVGKSCPICTEPLVKAVVLDTCGHTTCEACFQRWTAQRGQCPMCKTRANLRNIYRVTYSRKGRKQKVQVPSVDRRMRQKERFNVLDEMLLQAIQRIPIRSSLGSKLDLLTRHLLYIEQVQSGVKSLIFTAFSRGISLVGDALRLNGVKFVILDQGGARGASIIETFKNDASINVLLLHSEAQSSGLNLVCAQNVFLLEPLVNHSLELQAIGRVHRIGQTRPTSVFCYEVNETVEQRILDLSQMRGESLFTRENCVSSDLRDSAEMTAKVQESKASARLVKGGREGEFVGALDDLLACLFPHDVEEEEESKKEEQLQSAKVSDAAAAAAAASIPSMASTSNRQIAVLRATEEEPADDEGDLARMRRERLEAIERRRSQV